MNSKHLLVTILTVILSLVSTDFMSGQNFHYRKGWEYAEIDWERSAFSEWEDGMQAGEMSSTIMVAACYMREYGVGRNVSKGVSIMENMASKNTDVALFAANFWFPILDGDPFFDYSPHAGGQYNMWSMFKWWQEKDLRAENFGLEANYAKVIKFSKMYLAKVSTGYGVKLANEMIGYCYENGVGGVSKDIFKALEYYPDGDRFYNLAMKFIKSSKTVDELDNEVAKIKPYIKDKNVITAIESKTWTADYYLYCPGAREFLTEYIDMYSADVAKKVEDWWTLNNPLENPEQFNTEYTKVPQLWQTGILEKFTNLYNDICKSTIPESIKSLWIAYPIKSDKNFLDQLGSKYLEKKCDSLILNGQADIIKSVNELNQLKNDTVICATSYMYNKKQMTSIQFIDNKIDEAKSKWKSSYFKVITSHSSDDWLWKGNIIDIPESCKNYNLLYGTDSRGVGRDMLLKTMFNLFVMYNAVCSADKISKDLDINISLVNEQANKIKESYEFVKLLQNEDNKTITPEDYSSYLEKYPDAYYKQYCIDGYAMAKADTFTLDTPKDEIKKLLDSGISKGAAKYVKMVTKKSYLKSKSL